MIKGINETMAVDPYDVSDRANLGYCQLFKFKCAATRTCDAWLHGDLLGIVNHASTQRQKNYKLQKLQNSQSQAQRLEKVLSVMENSRRKRWLIKGCSGKKSTERYLPMPHGKPC